MKEVIISVDSKGGGASIRRAQATATKRVKRIYHSVSRIESHGLVNLDSYDGSKEYKFLYKIAY